MRIVAQQGDEDLAINLTPLIDMVFLLLIFFLVATTFAQEERDHRIELPRTGEAQPLSAPPQQLIINIRANGEMVVGPKVFTDMATLREMIERVARDDPAREVLIRCDERAFHRYFAEAARLCREAGIPEVKIGYMFAGS